MPSGDRRQRRASISALRYFSLFVISFNFLEPWDGSREHASGYASERVIRVPRTEGQEGGQ